MSTPPLPPPVSPSDFTCFNCGQALQRGAKFCPRCGAALPAQGSIIGPVLRALGAICLGGGAMVLGALGACFMLIGTSEGAGFGAVGLLFSVGALLCVWGMIALLKRK